MPAATLDQAAAECYAKMNTRWQANTLKADLAAFNTGMIVVFPNDGTQALRTVSNWIVVGTDIDAQMPQPPSLTSDALFNSAAEYVYRMCLAGSAASSAGRISGAQATAMLAVYNATID